MADADFWSGRLRRYGHTGWADPAIYAYDQRLRLRAVRQWLQAWRGPRRRALDFGCGVGDFAALLAQFLPSVTGYDIAPAILQQARRRVTAPGVALTDDRVAALAAGPYDVALCITVLQHVLDDDEARQLAAGLAAALAAGGSLLMLETLVDTPRPAAGYVHQRSAAELRALFEGAGLVLVSQWAFHHPQQAPTAAFARYYRRLDVRLLRRAAAAGWGWARARLDAIAERAVTEDNGALPSQDGPTQFFEFERPGVLEADRG